MIVADWGSNLPLCSVVKLTPEAASAVRFLTIPPHIAEAEQRDSPFPEVLALNAAVRRAQGQYIGRIDQDTLVGRRFLTWFFSALEDEAVGIQLAKCVMISNRRRIPYRLAVRSPSFEVMERYMRWFGRFLPTMAVHRPEIYWDTYIGILLFHRDLWYETRGYDETFIYMDYMEQDIFLRLTAKYEGFDLGAEVNSDFYHLDHSVLWDYGYAFFVIPGGRGRVQNPERNLTSMPPSFSPNSENWGLNQYSLELERCSRSEAPAASRGFARRRSRHWSEFLLLTVVSSVLTSLDLMRALMQRGLRRARKAYWHAHKLAPRIFAKG